MSCQKDAPETPPHHGMLKRVLHYQSSKDTFPASISEYEYDSKDKLVRIQEKDAFELFKYNQQGQLSLKSVYQINGDGSTLSDSTSYSYQNGNLIFEELIYLPPTNSSIESYQTKYEYEDSKLTRKKEYMDHQFRRLTKYKYSGSLCIRENQYYDSIGSYMDAYKIHIYENDQLSMSNFIITQGGDTVVQVIYYLYDENGNLITESAEPAWETATWFSYINRYEYY
ncbi:MAG TPA: hypothetical protein DCL77_11290 [Prolixibacteraceae bacterium]|jgi:hypothetical protein|nr:hypothetical protein [Prolixibacteraceae bacterium]